MQKLIRFKAINIACFSLIIISLFSCKSGTDKSTEKETDTAQPEPQTEEFSADIVYRGNIHRIAMVSENGIPSKMDLTEYLQDEYPGSIVQHIYVDENLKSSIKIKNDKRYHPAKLDWV